MQHNSMRIEVITPDAAASYLLRNQRNRAIRHGHVDDLQKQMKAGKWVLNGQPIIFDDEGWLIDGQHRLYACVKSGVAIISYVVTGVSDSRAFTTIDIGKVRGAHDMATYMGDLTGTQAKDCVAAARIIRAYQEEPEKENFKGYSYNSKLTNEEIASYALSINPMLLECSNHIGGRFTGLMDKSILTACEYLFCGSNKSAAFEFFDMLHDGVFSHQHHPIKMLRDTLMMRSTSKQNRREIMGEKMAIIFKAWAAFRKNKTVKLLRWTREGANCERFPELAK